RRFFFGRRAIICATGSIPGSIATSGVIKSMGTLVSVITPTCAWVGSGSWSTMVSYSTGPSPLDSVSTGSLIVLLLPGLSRSREGNSYLHPDAGIEPRVRDFDDCID